MRSQPAPICQQTALGDPAIVSEMSTPRYSGLISGGWTRTGFWSVTSGSGSVKVMPGLISAVTAEEGENTILPMLIAEGIDSAGENAGSASEKDGVLTIKTEADGSACTVTADSSTGDILTFRSPGNKLAVFFSDVSPYTEEVGVIE